jgi:hypothetical protein
MEWKTYDHIFCEGKILGQPEYLNSFSSFFISLFGLFGLFGLLNTIKQKSIITNNDIFSYLLSSLFVITGFGSTMFHWFGSFGFALLDEFPMIIATFIALICIEETIYKIKIYSPHIDIYNIVNIELNILTLKIIIYLFLMIIFLIINTLKAHRRLFPFYFGINNMYFIYRILILKNEYNTRLITCDNFNGSESINKQINNSIQKGIIILILSSIIWSITEFGCDLILDKNIIIKYLFLIGHPLWHFLSSYGFYILLEAINNIRQLL